MVFTWSGQKSDQLVSRSVVHLLPSAICDFFLFKKTVLRFFVDSQHVDKNIVDRHLVDFYRKVILSTAFGLTNQLVNHEIGT
jgi:hypothetical protein